jgi:hypothetical protein
MTEQTKRGRGRPPGEGKQDKPFLEEVADLLIADSRLKPTSAMKKVLQSRKDWGSTDETIIRRWQVKWKAYGAALLVTARERAKPIVSSAPPSSGAFDRQPSPFAFLQMTQELERSPYLEMIREMQNSRYVKMLQEAQNPLYVKMLREVQNSPDMQLARETQNSSATQLTPQMQYSSAKQIAREMDNFLSQLKRPY